MASDYWGHGLPSLGKNREMASSLVLLAGRALPGASRSAVLRRGMMQVADTRGYYARRIAVDTGQPRTASGLNPKAVESPALHESAWAQGALAPVVVELTFLVG